MFLCLLGMCLEWNSLVIVVYLPRSVQLSGTQRTAACQASLSFTITLSLLKFKFIESGMLSNHCVLCCPLLLLFSVFPGIRVFSSEPALRIRWRKDWSFSVNISPSNEYSGMISFRIDWFDLLDAQGTLKSFLQHHNSNHHFSGTQPSLWSNSHIYTWLLEKPGLWLYRPLSVQWCLCFLILSRFFIAFLPRNKHLLISWLQSLSTVILEPPKYVTVSTFSLFAMKWWDQMPWS